MDINALDTLTLRFVREEDTAENRTRLSPQFLQAYNEAYAALVQEKIRPIAFEDVTLDAQGGFSATALDYPLDAVLRVTQGQGTICRCREEGFGNYLVENAQGESVRVCYRHLPPSLTVGSDVPAFLPAAYHGALSLYAAAQYHAAEMRPARSEFFQQKYYELAANIHRAQDGTPERFTGAYPPRP
ncbi:MAG: hypothetical protein PHD32_11850 [Eubacteriales bacterium]|nr:hypothetical protein [Eubacteriales bacterium]